MADKKDHVAEMYEAIDQLKGASPLTLPVLQLLEHPNRML
jgi:hypothetical protein